MTTISSDSACVLIIDPDPLMLSAVAAALSMSGYESHGARDATAAMKAIGSLALDLVICDIDVDGGSGLELCQRIRRHPAGGELPFLFVSSEPAFDIVQRVHDIGGAYYLRKPYDPDVLLELVDKALWMPHLVHMRFEPPQAIRPTHLRAFQPVELTVAVRSHD